MAFIEDLRERIPSESADETTSYRCVDCLTEFDEQKRLCPTCGSDVFDQV